MPYFYLLISEHSCKFRCSHYENYLTISNSSLFPDRTFKKLGLLSKLFRDFRNIVDSNYPSAHFFLYIPTKKTLKNPKIPVVPGQGSDPLLPYLEEWRLQLALLPSSLLRHGLFPAPGSLALHCNCSQRGTVAVFSLNSHLQYLQLSRRHCYLVTVVSICILAIIFSVFMIPEALAAEETVDIPMGHIKSIVRIYFTALFCKQHAVWNLGSLVVRR